MPKIQIYQPQVHGLNAGPSPDTHPEAGEDVGQSIGMIGGAIKNLGDTIQTVQTNNEKSKIDVQSAQVMADLTNKWQDAKRNADPNDDQLAKKFQDNDISPSVDNLGDLASTPAAQRYAQERMAQIKGHFSVQTTADQAQLQGEAAKQNYVMATNNLSVAAQANPMAIRDLIDQHDSMIANLPHLTTEQKLALSTEGRGQIAMAAARGAININPWQAGKDIEQYGGAYLNGTQVAQLKDEAERMGHYRQQDAKIEEQMQRQAQRDASEDRRNKVMASLVDPDTGQTRIPPNFNSQVLVDPTLRPEDKQTLIAFGTHLANQPEAKTDPSVFNDYWRRANLPLDDPNRLTDQELQSAAAQGKIAKASDMNQIFEAMHGSKSPAGVRMGKFMNNLQDMAKNALMNPNYRAAHMPDPVGDAAVAEFMSTVPDRLAQGRAAGKTDEQLLNPNSADFIGKEIKPDMSKLNDHAKSILGAGAAPTAPLPKAEPRKEGESPEAYLARIRGK